MFNLKNNALRHSLQKSNQSINGLVQGLSNARRDIRSTPLNKKAPFGQCIGAGMKTGSWVASGWKYSMKWVVGRGVKPSDMNSTQKRTVLKQNGVIGVVLKYSIKNVNKILKKDVSQTSSVGNLLLDTTMSGLRFLVISLPEAALVAMSFYLSVPLEFVCAGASGIKAGTKNFFGKSKNSGVGNPEDDDADVLSTVSDIKDIESINSFKSTYTYQVKKAGDEQLPLFDVDSKSNIQPLNIKLPSSDESTLAWKDV